MSEAHLTERGARLRAGEWLGLAAAPTFAVMAALTAVADGPLDVLCGAGASPLGGSAVGGMAMMYGLMGAFHLAPCCGCSRARVAGGQPRCRWACRSGLTSPRYAQGLGARRLTTARPCCLTS
jgi:hypothetical protein